MLIHGAIIAREYGIPCVTGVPDAVNQIKTGDFITVDGHLGIVIIGEATLHWSLSIEHRSLNISHGSIEIEKKHCVLIP